ncbi:MAG: DUF2064 domain-containing protein [Phycisphaerae bacterium]|nr:DUF2064 domain-containing protein [Phycisphaerae bacterium]
MAILLFASPLPLDRRRRHLPQRLAPLLALPRLETLHAEADLHWFTDGPIQPRRNWSIHRQHGRTFGQRLQHAIDRLVAAGYARIIIIGRDCPQLDETDVRRAISLLESKRLVLGPDHRGGCWLIGFHASCRQRLHNICWQRNTDAAELLARFEPGAVEQLPVKIDLDDLSDVPRLARRLALAAYLLRLLVPPLPAASGSVRRQRLLMRWHQRPPPLAPCMRVFC